VSGVLEVQDSKNCGIVRSKVRDVGGGKGKRVYDHVVAGAYSKSTSRLQERRGSPIRKNQLKVGGEEKKKTIPCQSSDSGDVKHGMSENKKGPDFHPNLVIRVLRKEVATRQ